MLALMLALMLELMLALMLDLRLQLEMQLGWMCEEGCTWKVKLLNLPNLPLRQKGYLESRTGHPAG